MKRKLSIIIPTYNEEIHINRVLDSLSELDAEIYIIDSSSTDKTVEIAESYNCIVHSGKWERFDEKMNWAIDNLPINTEWVMRVDADEKVTAELSLEINNVISTSDNEFNGYWVKRVLYFMSKPIRHGGYYPFWDLRLWKNGKARYENRIIDEHLLIEGKTSKLTGELMDHKLNGLSFWMKRHINYAAREAKQSQEMTDEGKLSGYGKLNRLLKKNFYYRTPLFLRAFLHWFYRYFLRLGFLDGKEGFIFYILHSFWYRFYIDCLIYESKTGVANSEEIEMLPHD